MAAPSAQELLTSDDPSPQKVIKAKKSKNVHSGIATILATFNNTHVSLTDKQGNLIAWSTAGKNGFRGSRKSTSYAAQKVAQDAARRAMAHGLKEIEVRVKGPGSGRESAIRALQAVGLEIRSLPHRPPSPPRASSDVETGFALQATADALNVPAGGTAMVTVTSARRGYNGPIEIVAIDLPAGFTSIPTVIGKGQNSVVLTVSATTDAASGKWANIRIVGRAKVGAQDYESVASVETALKTRFAAMLWPPRTLTGAVGLGVAPAAQITLKVETQSIVFGKSLTAKIKVTANTGRQTRSERG